MKDKNMEKELIKFGKKQMEETKNLMEKLGVGEGEYGLVSGLAIDGAGLDVKLEGNTSIIVESIRYIIESFAKSVELTPNDILYYLMMTGPGGVI